MASATGHANVVIADSGFRNERDLSVANISLNWRQNGAGRGSFQIRARDAHLMGFRAMLGRWVYVDDFQPWAGVVEDTPVEVSTGVYELSCTDMSDLLYQSITPRTYKQDSGVPGALISRAIRDSGQDEQLWINSVSCDQDGLPVVIEWRGQNTGSVVQSLANAAGGAWTVTVNQARVISFTYYAFPPDKRNSILLVEGREVLTGSIRPGISNLYNDIVGVGNDRDWARAAGARVIDEKSRRLYGRRRLTKSYPGHTRPSSIESAARADLAMLSKPSGPVSLDIWNRHPILKDVRVGQLVTLWSTSENRKYDLEILGMANEWNRGTVTVAGTIIEQE